MRMMKYVLLGSYGMCFWTRIRVWTYMDRGIEGNLAKRRNSARDSVDLVLLPCMKASSQSMRRSLVFQVVVTLIAIFFWDRKHLNKMANEAYSESRQPPGVDS